MTGVGIQKIATWPSTLCLSMTTLCRARPELDAAYVRDELIADARTVLPPWEDTVTLAVNAAERLLTPDDIPRIGLLVFATETSLDREKAASTWVHRHLGLGSRCRNFEVKHACYGATAALRVAEGWLATRPDDDAAALVVSADHNLLALGQPYEPVNGAGAVALLVSRRPDVLSLEPGAGVFAVEEHGVVRPTAHIETGNAAASLYAYVDALDGALDDYEDTAGPFEPDAFAACIYHMPFAGMGRRAHRVVMQRAGVTEADAIEAAFTRQVLPGLRHLRRIGATYGASTFVGLQTHAERLDAGARVSLFAYGTGSCAELYTGRIGPGARACAAEAALGALVDARAPLDVDVYRALERARDAAWERADFTPDRALVPGHFEAAWAGTGRLYLDGVCGYERRYRRA